MGEASYAYSTAQGSNLKWGIGVTLLCLCIGSFIFFDPFRAVLFVVSVPLYACLRVLFVCVSQVYSHVEVRMACHEVLADGAGAARRERSKWNKRRRRRREFRPGRRFQYLLTACGRAIYSGAGRFRFVEVRVRPRLLLPRAVACRVRQCYANLPAGLSVNMPPRPFLCAGGFEFRLRLLFLRW